VKFKKWGLACWDFVEGAGSKSALSRDWLDERFGIDDVDVSTGRRITKSVTGTIGFLQAVQHYRQSGSYPGLRGREARRLTRTRQRPAHAAGKTQGRGERSNGMHVVRA